MLDLHQPLLQVTLETPQSLAHKLKQFDELQDAFGWKPDALAVVLNPANKVNRSACRDCCC